MIVGVDLNDPAYSDSGINIPPNTTLPVYISGIGNDNTSLLIQGAVINSGTIVFAVLDSGILPNNKLNFSWTYIW